MELVWIRIVYVKTECTILIIREDADIVSSPTNVTLVLPDFNHLLFIGMCSRFQKLCNNRTHGPKTMLTLPWLVSSSTIDTLIGSITTQLENIIKLPTPCVKCTLG